MNRFTSDKSLYLQLKYFTLCACLLSGLSVISSACGRARIPVDNVTVAEEIPSLIPDYTDIVIPPNIAPMNFEIDMPGVEFISRVTSPDGKSLTAEGKVAQWDIEGWHELLEASKGKTLSYEVFVKERKDDDSWKCYRFQNRVAEEEIDPYLSYRLIEPSYQQYAGMTINQRNLTNFDEEVVFNNAAPCDERRGFCINCHVPRNHYKDHSSQFHVRKFRGGTVIMSGDSVLKVNLQTDSTLSAGVYPAWHPTLDLIAYSTNLTNQNFFKRSDNKVEVYDNASDLILYDMKTGEVSHIANDPDLLETFPVWHPEGDRIYYSVARYPEGANADNVLNYFSTIRYDIVSRDFDVTSRKFSRPDTVVNASAKGESVLLPRVSPDGRYLLYCKAPYGTFHIWHKESDLYMKDLVSGEERPLSNANSDDTDSYHTWSSNSRWIVFSSRRDDGSYTRPYITYISQEGEDSKAFVVPQETPDYYRQLMKSYNVPEFFEQPFSGSRPEILDALLEDARPVTFRPA